MIEVNLYSISSQDVNTTVGRCIARSRFNKESLGVSIMEFTKGFLKNNLSNFESALGNESIVSFINSDTVMSTRDLSCINYWLSQAGYLVQIVNVADDEENPVSVPEGVVEWNVIDYNFIQYDYPTATKIVPGEGSEIVSVLKQIVDQSGLFDQNKMSGVKNPFTVLINNLENIKSITGSVNSNITSKIYELLAQMNIKVFCAVSEN